MMNKLQRYSAVTKTGVESVYLASDVAALEAQNEILIAALQECIIQRFYPEKVSEIAIAAILDHEQESPYEQKNSTLSLL